MEKTILFYIAFINLFAFIAYGIDRVVRNQA